MNSSVTVIIPTFNQGKYIKDAINSISSQTYPLHLIETIVIDDGSTDNTKEITASCGEEIIYSYQKNAGQGAAVKQGILMATGEYIFILNADDIYSSQKISKTVGIFQKDKDITHIAHPVIYWNTKTGDKKKEKFPLRLKGKVLEGQKVLYYFYSRNCFYGGGSTYAGRAKIWKKGPINGEVNMSVDEYLSIMSLSFGKGYFFNEALSLYRLHDENYSGVRNKNILIKDCKATNVIRSLLVELPINKNILVLYSIKSKVLDLILKEYKHEKTFTDIIFLWKYFLKNSKYFLKSFIIVIHRYRLLIRSLPTSVLWKIKNLSQKR